MNSEQPWRFLTACFEWNRYLSSPDGFLSDLPVTIDGTCNGLQHIAALRRDSRLAQMTNLERRRRPEDIYLIVAERLRTAVGTDHDSGNEMATAWLTDAQIDRDLCKKAVMTTPYGVTYWGMMLQLFESELTKRLHIPGAGPIRREHVKNFGRLEQRLRDHADGRSKVIWAHLSKTAKRMLQSGKEPEKNRIATVVDELNSIIQGTSIYSTESFHKVSKETRAYLGRHLYPRLRYHGGTNCSFSTRSTWKYEKPKVGG